MCKNRHYSGRVGKRWKFFKHLRIYLLVNITMGLLAYRYSGQPWEWLPVAFFWGIGLFFHYLQVFRPWVSRSLSRQWERQLLERERRDQEELELGQLRPRRKAWDERDLV